MLPAPCIALALALQANDGGFAQFRLKAPLIHRRVSPLRAQSEYHRFGASIQLHHEVSSDGCDEPRAGIGLLGLSASSGLANGNCRRNRRSYWMSGDASELYPAGRDASRRRSSSVFVDIYLPFMLYVVWRVRSPDVRVINLSLQHTVYPVSVAAILHDTILQSQPMGYSSLWQEHARLGPYRLYLLPGGTGAAPQFPLRERPAYENGLRLLGYDALGCDGNWQLHWTPGHPARKGEPVHFFVHLLDAESEAWLSGICAPMISGIGARATTSS